MKITALTSGKNSPAGRFRIRQHILSLFASGIVVNERYPSIDQLARLPGAIGRMRTRYLPPIVIGQIALNATMRVPGIIDTWKSDALWLERSFIPGLEPAIHLTKGPRFLDVDDAIWMMNPMGEASAAHLARNVDAVIAGNSFLAAWYARHCRNVHIIPTAIDCQRYRPKASSLDSEFVIGWTGTSGNFKYFDLIEEPLANFLSSHKEASLLIVADRDPAFRIIPPERVKFMRWTAESEASILHRMTVGIMPLDDTPWARGKCSFKMLQYMASGLPVIASPVGMNAEVLTKGDVGFPAASGSDWYHALQTLYLDRSLGEKMGALGRRVVVDNYSAKIVSAQLAEIFRG